MRVCIDLDQSFNFFRFNIYCIVRKHKHIEIHVFVLFSLIVTFKVFNSINFAYIQIQHILRFLMIISHTYLILEMRTGDWTYDCRLRCECNLYTTVYPMSYICIYIPVGRAYRFSSPLLTALRIHTHTNNLTDASGYFNLYINHVEVRVHVCVYSAEKEIAGEKKK